MMGMCTKAIGSMIKRKARAFTSILMALDTRETGTKISSMGMETRRGLMELNIKASSSLERRKEQEPFTRINK